MCVFGSLTVICMGFARCGNGFRFAFPFLDSHGVMGFFILLSFGLSDGFGTKRGDLRKIPKGLEIP